MQLSKRLQMVADMVSQKNKVADVGCDHAYTSIYLVKNRQIPYIIAMDINQGPLAKAAENVKRYGCRKEIELRRSNGLQALTVGEVDTVLLAGMGGGLMIRILSESKEIVMHIQEVILQPQSEIYLVRQYLHNIGWRINGEEMCCEEDKLYTVIRAVPDKECIKMERTEDIRDIYFHYGEILLKKHHPILQQFLEKEFHNKQNLLKQLNLNATEKSEERIGELKVELERLVQALNFKL